MTSRAFGPAGSVCAPSSPSLELSCMALQARLICRTLLSGCRLTHADGNRHNLIDHPDLAPPAGQYRHARWPGHLRYALSAADLEGAMIEERTRRTRRGQGIGKVMGRPMTASGQRRSYRRVVVTAASPQLADIAGQRRRFEKRAMNGLLRRSTLRRPPRSFGATSAALALPITQ
jgi:hypothetical protein